MLVHEKRQQLCREVEIIAQIFLISFYTKSIIMIVKLNFLIGTPFEAFTLLYINKKNKSHKKCYPKNKKHFKVRGNSIYLRAKRIAMWTQ